MCQEVPQNPGFIKHRPITVRLSTNNDMPPGAMNLYWASFTESLTVHLFPYFLSKQKWLKRHVLNCLQMQESWLNHRYSSYCQLYESRASQETVLRFNLALLSGQYLSTETVKLLAAEIERKIAVQPGQSTGLWLQKERKVVRIFHPRMSAWCGSS